MASTEPSTVAGPDPGDDVARSVTAATGALPRPPRLVWLATLLLGLVSALWTVAVPAYRAPDEAAHLDLVLHLADGNGYPAYDDRYFGEAIGLDSRRYLVDSDEDWPRFAADDAPPRRDRRDADDLGGTAPDPQVRPREPAGRPDYPYMYNQMPQHPPLYYMGMAGLLGVERWLLPGDDLPSLDRELGLLRLANVLLVLPLPLLAWATVMRLTSGTGRRAGIVASLLPLGLPQLTYIGGSLNNDNLLLLLGGILCVLLTGVARGHRTRRTDVAVGVVLGLALLTKGFALMFLPWAGAAYALHAWTRSRGGDGAPDADDAAVEIDDGAPPAGADGQRSAAGDTGAEAEAPAATPTAPSWWSTLRPTVLGGAVAVGVAAVVGGWWWVANWIRYGEPAPTTESLTRNPGGATLPDPDHVGFVQKFVGNLFDRTWSWIGFRMPKLGELDWKVVVLLTLAVAVAVAVATVWATPGTRVGDRPRRWDVLLAWFPVVLLAAFVARRAWGLYLETGMLAFTQGRYLFAAFAGPMAIVALGTVRVLGSRAVYVALALGCALQAWVLAAVVRGAWSGDGRWGSLSGALAWSPWPSALVIAAAVAAVVTAAAIAATAHRAPA